MNEEEFKECSVVAYPHEIRFLHIKGGHISYYVDRHVSDYVNKLQQELQKYKSLYQNEKDKNDTLKRIIKKIEEYCNSIIKGCDVKDDDGNYLYFYPPYMDDILDLLKEIK